MLVAVVAIPLLVKGLGTERFGLLNLAWIVLGYFSFFDFGIAKGLTKIVAEKIGNSDCEQIPSIFWSSMILMFALGFFIMLILLIFLEPLTNLVNTSPVLRKESLQTFYIIVISIPIVTTTAGSRGFLEAYQKFGMINLARVFLGILTFLVPLICLIFSNNLALIVLLLLVMRVIVWFIYLKQCWIVNPKIKTRVMYNHEIVKPVFKFSVWITVANLVGPLITNLDRFLIGALISATAVAYYATPYELVSKLLLIPNALVVVLFPIFSANSIQKNEDSKKYFYVGTKSIFLILFPIVFLLVCFAHPGLKLWLGYKFADEGGLVLQVLAIATLINGLAYIPFNFFQGIGKPEIPAILNLIELPIYVVAMWVMILNYGIVGAAITCLLRIIFDTIIIFIIALIRYGFRFESWFSVSGVVSLFFLITIPMFTNNLLLNSICALIGLFLFGIFSLKIFLSSQETGFVKDLIFGNLKSLFNQK